MGSQERIEKVPPLSCPQCCSTSVTINQGSITCDECKYKTKKNGKKEKVRSHTIGGKNPWCDTGNYLE